MKKKKKRKIENTGGACSPLEEAWDHCRWHKPEGCFGMEIGQYFALFSEPFPPWVEEHEGEERRRRMVGARSIVFPNRGASRSRDYARLTRDVTIRLDWRYTWNRLEGHFGERFTPLNPTGSPVRSQKPLNPSPQDTTGRSNGNCTKALFKWLSISTVEHPGRFQLITFMIYFAIFNRSFENSLGITRQKTPDFFFFFTFYPLLQD